MKKQKLPRILTGLKNDGTRDKRVNMKKYGFISIRDKSLKVLSDK